MAILDISIVQDVDEALNWVNARPNDQIGLTAVAEQILNHSITLLEMFCNRPLKQRLLTNHTQDGSGRRLLILEQERPIVELRRLEIFDFDFNTSQIVDVTPAAREVSIKSKEGMLFLLPNANRSVFSRGVENIMMDIVVGYGDDELFFLKQAQLELFAVQWFRMMRDPLEISKSDNINTASTTTLADFNLLPHTTQMALQVYRNFSV